LERLSEKSPYLEGKQAKMKLAFAILGAGNVGCAAAVYLTMRGHRVNLCSSFAPQHASPIIDRQGLDYSGVLGEGFVRLSMVTTDVGQAIKDVDVVMITTPATVHRYYVDKISAHLRPDQIVFLNPGGVLGSLCVAKQLKDQGMEVLPSICETNTATHGCRLTEPYQISIYLVANYLLFSAFPSTNTGVIHEHLIEAFPALTLTANILETGLMYPNAVLHPPVALMNAGWIEYTKGNFLFYCEGVTDSIAKVIEAIDEERQEVMRAFGLAAISFLEQFRRRGYTSPEARSIAEALKASGPNKTIKAPTNLEHRYLTEDIPMGLVPISSLARIVNVQTPLIEAMITLASAVNGINYRANGVTFRSLGLNNLGLDEFRTLLDDGFH
jgi:opine dehydrogenase